MIDALPEPKAPPPVILVGAGKIWFPVKELLQKAGYEVHSFVYAGLTCQDILEGGKDSDNQTREPLKDVERLFVEKNRNLKDHVFILQAGGGNDMLAGDFRIGMRVTRIIEELSKYSNKIIVNNRHPIWPATRKHWMANEYLDWCFQGVWNGIMQDRNLILANLRGALPDESDVLGDNSLTQHAVIKQVELYDSIIKSTNVWNQVRKSFPENKASCLAHRLALRPLLYASASVASVASLFQRGSLRPALRAADARQILVTLITFNIYL